MGTQMLQRRGTSAEWAAANVVLGDGEIGFDRTTGEFRIGDGVTPWNSLVNTDIFIPKSTLDELYTQRSIVDAAGDILVGSADNTLTRLAKGTANQRLTVDGAGNLVWADLPNPFAVIDAAGDLLVGSGPDAVARLPKGTIGYVLTIDGSGNVAWASAPAADLSSRVAKSGDTMTGALKMDNTTGIHLRGQAGQAAADIVLYKGAGASLLVRKLDGTTPAPLEAGALYDNNNRVYSASNPPPASGMTVLGGGGASGTTTSSTYVNYGNSFNVVAPASGRVVVHVTVPGTPQGGGYLTYEFNGVTRSQDRIAVNSSQPSVPVEQSYVLTGLTPGATYSCALRLRSTTGTTTGWDGTEGWGQPHIWVEG